MKRAKKVTLDSPSSDLELIRQLEESKRVEIAVSGGKTIGFALPASVRQQMIDALTVQYVETAGNEFPAAQDPQVMEMIRRLLEFLGADEVLARLQRR